MNSKKTHFFAAQALITALAFSNTLAAPTEITNPETRSSGLAGTYLSARYAEADASLTQAANYFVKALQHDPENSSLLRQAYFLNAQIGRIDIAIPHAKKSYVNSSRLAIAPLIIAIGHYREGDYEKAKIYIDRMSTRSLNGFALPMLKAWAFAAINDRNSALAAIAPYQHQELTQTTFNIVAGLLMEYFDEKVKAAEHYVKVAEEPNHSIAELRVITAALHRVGSAENAKELIQRYRNSVSPGALSVNYLNSFADPGFGSKEVTAQLGMAEALFSASQLLLQNNNRGFSAQVSIVYAQLALYLNKNFNLARRVIGATLTARNFYKESNIILNEIARDTPGHLSAQLLIAENLERVDRTEDALNVLRSVAQQNLTRPEPLISIGDILRRNDRFREAVAAYDEAFDRYPNREPSEWAIYYTRGIALEQAKYWRRAEKDFKKALELKPDEAIVLNYLGYSWLARGENITKAREMIELAVTKRPEDGFIIDSLGWAMYLMKEYPDAVTYLEKATDLQPSDPTINEHLGDAYWKVGRRNEAHFQWRRALSMDPDQVRRASIRAKLDQGLVQN